MNKLFFFKVTFLSISVGLFVGLLVYGSFDVDFSNSQAIQKLVIKSLVVALATGFIMGILNMFFKIGPMQKNKE